VTDRLSLRPAAATDAALLLDLRNDAETRQQSFTSHRISQEEHERWLQERLEAQSETRIYIGEVGGEAVGQARVDRTDPRRGLISVSIAEGRRGAGLGSRLIRQASDAAAADLGLDLIVAMIKPANGASLSAFRRAGYERGRQTTYRGEDAEECIWRAHHA
jgi:RimJ/RimL family protein N-acetyltransferase